MTILIKLWDSSVSIVTRYGLDGPGIESRSGPGSLHPSILALGPTQPPIELVLAIFPEVKQLKRGLDYPPHLETRLKKE